jgi:hypothetical protein
MPAPTAAPPVFDHLDCYQQPIDTLIAEPALARPVTVSVPDVIARLAPPGAQRWPPPATVPGFPSVPSLLADHCAWMVRRVPTEYLRRFYVASGRAALPGLGHLHFLYGADCPDLPVQHFDPEFGAGTDGPVSLPTDLCICDCPLIAGPPPTTTHANAGAVVDLVARCIAEVAEWTPYPADAFPATAAAGGPLALLGDTLPDDGRTRLTDALRRVDGATGWVHRLVETVGVASDLPIRLMQYALWRYAPRAIPFPELPVAWAVLLAARHGTGALAGVVPRGAALDILRCGGGGAAAAPEEEGAAAVAPSPVWRSLAALLPVPTDPAGIVVVAFHGHSEADVPSVDVNGGRSPHHCHIVGPIDRYHGRPDCTLVWPRLDLVLLIPR